MNPNTTPVPAPLSIGWSVRVLTVAIATLTVALTVWAGAQARAVEQQLDRVARTVPFTPVRQIEHDEQTRAAQIEAAERHDAARFADRLAPSSGRPTARELLQIEYTELRRFRTIAPPRALPALDAEIERLRSELESEPRT